MEVCLAKDMRYSNKRLRFTALILCITMLIGCMPVLGFASSDSGEPIVLEYVYPEDGDNMFSIATQSAAVSESGKYTVVVVRSGQAADTASVELKTVDISAVYGEDYVISVGSSPTDITETDGTLLEQAADYEEQSTRYAELEEQVEEIEETAAEAEAVTAETETE